jgi:hypothetical protein
VGLSFQEKSLWLMLVSLVACSSLYGAAVVPGHGANVQPHQVGFFALLVALLVALQVVGHTVIAVVDRRTGTDERDRLFELLGTRNGAYVLATGVFASLCTALITDGNFVFVHVLLGSWVLAQLVDTGSQLWLYRRGA